MNELQQNIQEIEIHIDTAKKRIKKWEHLENLRKNPDFKSLIEDDYFKEEASRLVLLKASQQMESQESQIRILNMIDAIGHLQQFFMLVEGLGKQAAGALREDEDTLAEMRQENE